MRLRITFILLGLAVAGAVSGALVTTGGVSKSGGGKLRVVAAFYPLAYAAEQIGGDKVSVKNLTPAGAEPHDLEVSPADVTTVRAADLVLLLGHGFQPQLERAARGTAGTVLMLLDTPGLDRFSNGDPHVWLDPRRYVLLVKALGKALHEPAAAERFVARLGALDHIYRTGLAHCARREIVTSHAAFAYLAQRYGLNQISLEGLNPEGEPAPRELAHVVNVVRENGVTTVFFETLVSPKLARTVARETGAKTAVLDPIEGLTPDETARGADYFSVMRSNLAHLRQGLGCS
jgi:zinc transport system substrate-binding protein